MSVASRLASLSLLSVSFVPCITGSASAAVAEPPAEATTAAPAETPSATVPESSAPVADAPTAVEATGPGGSDSAPGANDAVAVPQAPPAAAEDSATEATPAEPREGTDVAATEAESPAPGPEKSEPIAQDLLSSDADSAETAPPPRTRTVVQDPGAYEASVAAAYDAEYRPAHNPGMLHVAGRALFAYAGGDGEVGGRMGGAQVDIGQAWNRFGYALTASAWGGRIGLSDRVSEVNALLGVGPTFTLGRAALQQRGLIDLRLGYDVMFGVVNQRADGGTVVAPQNDSSIAIEAAENLVPHGPRVMLQLGLLSPKPRRYHHGFGVVFGYQGLVGSLRGELPFTHMLVTGLQWWMG